MNNKEKIWKPEEAKSFIEFLDEYGMVENISEPVFSGEYMIYTVKLKLDKKDECISR